VYDGNLTKTELPECALNHIDDTRQLYETERSGRSGNTQYVTVKVSLGTFQIFQCQYCVSDAQTCYLYNFHRRTVHLDIIKVFTPTDAQVFLMSIP